MEGKRTSRWLVTNRFLLIVSLWLQHGGCADGLSAFAFAYKDRAVISPVAKRNQTIAGRASEIHRVGNLILKAHLSATSGDGGADDDDDDDDNLVSSSAVVTNSFQQRGMSLSLAMTYFTVMGAKCALPAVLSLLMAPDTGLTFPPTSKTDMMMMMMTPQQLVARLLTLATLAIALGKLLLGPLIDHWGGIFSLQVALTLLMILLGTIASCQSFAVFAVAWIAVDFIFSSCWAGCINAIHQSFPSTQWAAQIGTLAAAARTGNAAGFAIFAAVLHGLESKMRQAWRPVFALAAVAQVVPLVLLHIFGTNRGKNKFEPKSMAKNNKPSFGLSLMTLKREASTLDFWLHFVNRSVLMVYASFLLFVPTLMKQVYQSSSSFAAQVGSIYALGCLLSVTAGSRLYPTLKRKEKLLLLTFLLGGAILSSFGQLGHMSGWWKLGSWGSAMLLFFWGVAFSIPFYIPGSLFALERGGKESSATITDIFDAGGFGLLAGFNGYVASIAEPTDPLAWRGTFRITTVCAILSYISLSLATWRENRYKH